jgi:hypothetical protein
VTIETVNEPVKTFKVYSLPARCSVDSFFSDRCIFEHHFAPVTTSKLRLLVRDVTFGGWATADVEVVDGGVCPPPVVVREIEVYRAHAPVLLFYAPRARSDRGEPCRAHSHKRRARPLPAGQPGAVPLPLVPTIRYTAIHAFCGRL